MEEYFKLGHAEAVPQNQFRDFAWVIEEYFELGHAEAVPQQVLDKPPPKY